MTPHRPMTYAAFERMLARFDFSKTELDEINAVVFEHAATGATLIVPKGEPEETVPHTNLVTARRTILAKGIASSSKYALSVAHAENVTPAPKKKWTGNKMAEGTVITLS